MELGAQGYKSLEHGAHSAECGRVSVFLTSEAILNLFHPPGGSTFPPQAGLPLEDNQGLTYTSWEIRVRLMVMVEFKPSFC